MTGLPLATRTTMRLVLLACVLFVTGCDSAEEPPPIEEVFGTWQALYYYDEFSEIEIGRCHVLGHMVATLELSPEPFEYQITPWLAPTAPGDVFYKLTIDDHAGFAYNGTVDKPPGRLISSAIIYNRGSYGDGKLDMPFLYPNRTVPPSTLKLKGSTLSTRGSFARCNGPEHDIKLKRI